jgi:hypothetical protein
VPVKQDAGCRYTGCEQASTTSPPYVLERSMSLSSSSSSRGAVCDDEDVRCRTHCALRVSHCHLSLFDCDPTVQCVNKERTTTPKQQVQHSGRIRHMWYTISMLGNANFILPHAPRNMIDTGRWTPSACIDGECMHRRKSAGSEMTRAKSQP